MNTQYAQIKLNLPVRLRELLKAKASQWGFSVPLYIKNLIISDMKKEDDYPVFQASDSVLEAIKQAKNDVKEGKTTIIKTKKDLYDYFSKLEEKL